MMLPRVAVIMQRASSPRVIAMLFVCQASLCVLVLAMLVPPFENSDEFNHFNRVDQIAGGGLIATRYGGPATSGGDADPGIDQVDAIIAPVRFHPERKVSGQMLRQAGAIAWHRRARTTFPNTSVYAPFLYLPASIAVLAGRHLGLSIAPTLILARAAGGLIWVGIAGVALAFSGAAAPLLLVLLSLPMSLSLFAAVSQDGGMLAMAAVAVALAVRMPALAPRQASRGLVALCVALGLLGIGRPAYAPLAVLPLLLAEHPWRARWTGSLGVLAAIGAWSMLTAAFTMINADAPRGVNPRAQALWLLAHPAHVPGLAWRAMTDRQGMEGLPFYKEFIGVLGWIDVVLPGWFYAVALGAIVLAMLAQLPTPALAWPARAKAALAGAMLVGVGCLFLLEELTFTPVGFPWIEGVQGRYFLPLALFLPAVLPVLRFGPLARLGAVVLAFPAVSIAVTISSVVRRYYV